MQADASHFLKKQGAQLYEVVRKSFAEKNYKDCLLLFYKLRIEILKVGIASFFSFCGNAKIQAFYLRHTSNFQMKFGIK